MLLGRAWELRAASCLGFGRVHADGQAALASVVPGAGSVAVAREEQWEERRERAREREKKRRRPKRAGGGGLGEKAGGGGCLG